MKKLTLRLLLIGSALTLISCKSTDTKPKDTPMPQMQQNTYLSHTKAPQDFGFVVFPATDKGITYLGTTRLHPNQIIRAKMIKDDIPMIKVQGQSRRNKMNMLIDISSPNSWLEFSQSQDFRFDFLGFNDQVIPYRGNYNTGGQNAYAGVIRQLRIDTFFLENTPFYVRMSIGSLGPLARGIRHPPVDSILGYDNLRSFEYIQFNLKDKSIIFSADIPYTPNEDLLMATVAILNNPKHGLTIDGAIAGVPTPIILDFAGNFGFARGDRKVSISKQVSLGNLVYRQVPTLILPSANSTARAGRKMLEPYLITVCNHEGIVYFERPPKTVGTEDTK